MKNKLNKLYHGACWYPELWDEDVLVKDIAMMKEIGMNMVRIGEFWWSRIERNEGKFDTDYIVKLLDQLHKEGIDVVMCTPTPTPPIWITHNHPERLHVDEHGRRLIHGSRQHCCTNNENYRRYSYIIIDKIAEAIGNHPAVVLWQLDNEFKCHIRECYCETCKNQWHEWLEKKYGTIDNLNKAWGTMIWSEIYQSFDQVVQPFKATPFIHNASLETNYRIFHREKIAEFATHQADTIRKHCKAPITTNGAMGFGIDNEKLFENLDFVAYDTYAGQDSYHHFLLNIDFWRGIKKDKNFWLVETTNSHTGALDRLAKPLPLNYLVCEAVACYAGGSASFTYWLWRQQAVGCEISHSAVISAWGKPSVGYNSVLQVEEMRKNLEPFFTSTDFTKAEMAVTYSDRSNVFHEVENHKFNNQRAMFATLYNTILNTGFHRDVLPENMDFSEYKMLVTPFLWHLSDDYVRRAKAFVENGGIWIVGPMTGGRTEEHTVTLDAALGKELEDFAGVEALYTYSMDNSGGLGRAFGITAPLKLWSSVFDLKEGTKPIGTTIDGVTPDMPFITEKTVGKGKVVMLGSMPFGEEGEEMLRRLYLHYGQEAGLVNTGTTPGTAAYPRHDDENNYLVVVNMDGKGGHIILENGGFDVVTSKSIPDSALQIKAFEYKVIQLKNRLSSCEKQP